jgi:hypothetical protein
MISLATFRLHAPGSGICIIDLPKSTQLCRALSLSKSFVLKTLLRVVVSYLDGLFIMVPCNQSRLAQALAQPICPRAAECKLLRNSRHSCELYRYTWRYTTSSPSSMSPGSGKASFAVSRNPASDMRSKKISSLECRIFIAMATTASGDTISRRLSVWTSAGLVRLSTGY